MTMITALIRLLRLRSPTPPAAALTAPSIAEVEAALADLDGQRAHLHAALRDALDRRRAALLADDDRAVDLLDSEIDRLSREDERAEVIERELLDRAATVSPTTTDEIVP